MQVFDTFCILYQKCRCVKLANPRVCGWGQGELSGGFESDDAIEGSESNILARYWKA